MYSALFPTATQLTLRTLYRLFGQVDVLITLVGKSDINLIDATLVLHSDCATPSYTEPPKMATRLARRHLQRQIQDHRQDWQKRITDTTGLTSEDEIQATYKGLVTLFPRMEHPVGMIAPRAPRGLPCQRQQLLSSVLRVPHPHDDDDVSDETVRVEFKHLLTDGTWPSESIVLECITDASR
ncbi:hypothetical protein GS432_08010, partial [Rhodococcus hoagii]|nr:hypothetical protein [Prescottella equi]